MNYGFLIRNDRCIGCHACSTACKSENDVPLGVNRTWVKNVEKGRYPDVRRHFQVTRCNHCANPPCVRICPVTAMYQRADGIVEFDPQVCIGCKACLQACPYDAIYIDPDSGTAAKCHFCAHRVEMNLEPACVVVCPEHAIISGDLDDPISEISRMLAQYQTTVRKPEQGTAPKLFYVDGEETSLHPSATDRAPVSFAWSDVLSLHGDKHPHDALPVAHRAPARPASNGGSGHTARSGVALRDGDPQGLPPQGPIHIGADRMAGDLVRTVYNAQHKIPWHWPVPAYLVTKGAGSGVFALLAVASLFGLAPVNRTALVAGGLASLVLIAITTALLVLDLERPERFLSILLRPQWKSWLTKGAVLLVAFSTLVGVWWALEAAALAGWIGAGPVAAVRPWALGIGLPLSVGVAIYTAFLFGQAEGRDLWQSSLLPAHLLVQMGMAGAATLLLMDAFVPFGPALVRMSVIAFVIFLVADLLVTLGGEFAMPHASADAARAAAEITRGRYRLHFWLGSIGIGHALPLALLVSGTTLAAALASALSLVGLYLYEYAFVMAPQEVPNS
jgi:Fe-S-cluster-containing dehydrogenase component/formate-dependent nitrite reductase membrane component NrfD